MVKTIKQHKTNSDKEFNLAFNGKLHIQLKSVRGQSQGDWGSYLGALQWNANMEELCPAPIPFQNWDTTRYVISSQPTL